MFRTKGVLVLCNIRTVVQQYAENPEDFGLEKAFDLWLCVIMEKRLVFFVRYDNIYKNTDVRLF